MGRDEQRGPKILLEAVQRRLREAVGPDARLVSMAPLGADERSALKTYGYGRPLLLTVKSAEGEKRLVLRTMSSDPFGHDRRGDRLAVLAGAADTFGSEPGHVRALELGAFDEAGELHPIPAGEPYLLTEYVEGRLYAEDLRALAGRDEPSERDRIRARALALHLVALHAQPAPPEAYGRCVRDTVGGGEGIFGLCDSYPNDHEVATRARLNAIEAAAVGWRWRLMPLARRSRRTHGDFHPFNVLFREGADFSVLDRSRGGAGEPADDVTCMATNYLFFALAARGQFRGALRALWDEFWSTYLEGSKDDELTRVAAPFLTWRLLVVASPLWYPDIPDATRDLLLRVAERALSTPALDPARIDAWLE